MTSSFSQYASKYLNGRLAPSPSLASSQPLFYSFQDSSDGESSSGRVRLPQIQASDNLELDDHGEPRLRGEEEVEDPYLRLDEDDGDIALKESIPLISSEAPSTQVGWLAHQTSLPSRSPTPPSTEPSGSSPPNIVEPSIPPTHISLTESLLPRDGVSRSVFSLPDPGRVSRYKYNDVSWTILWCTSLTICFLGFLAALYFTPSTTQPTPYSTLTRIIPLLTVLTVLCTFISYTHMLFLRHFARPVLIATAFFIPVSLFLSAFSAFSGSFIYDGPTIPSTWATTIGLRLFALTPLLLMLLSAHTLFARISLINKTAKTVQLATTLLLSTPPLLAVSPGLLIAALLGTLPFLSLVFRLFLIGYYGNREWHIQSYAAWIAVGTCIIWIWSWCVMRGVLRVTAAGVVGAWFFKRDDPSASAVDQLQVTRSALSRAWGPSMGTICISAFVQATIGTLSLILRGLRRMSSPTVLPDVLHPLSIPIVFLSNILSPFTFSGYTLPYAGLTGEAFFSSSRRARDVTSIKRLNVAPPSYSLLSTLLLLSSLSLSMLLGLTSYLFTAHTLLRPEHAPLGALLTGAVTFLVSWFCSGVVEDIADALYICYCLDQERGSRSREEVFEAFEGQRSASMV